MKKFFFTVIFLLVLVTFWFINIYNTLVQFNENIQTQWGQVENVYQRRSDLIPNLVNTVKGSANFEKETLKEVIEARSKATSIQLNNNDLSQEKIDRYQKVQDKLSSSIGRLLLISENYPELKSTIGFSDLQHQIEGTENRISVERNKYNETVNIFNTYRNQFPKIVVANVFKKFQEKGYFKSQYSSNIAPKVNFLNKILLYDLLQ